MTRLSTKLAALALGAATVTGCAVSAAQPSSGDTQDGTRCEIRVSERGAMLVLEAIVHADQALSGRATFAVDGLGRAGSTKIKQSTGFTASPGQPATLGRTMVMAGAQYDVSLTANADGERLVCEERIGGV